MSATRIQTHAVQTFQCLGDACPDTCCKGWGMQVAPPTIAKFEAEAPELLEAVTSGEAEFVMRRDPQTDYCVKFDAGWCSIHRDYGADFLGDACHFYPRITRALADTVITSMALSCPEAARLMLTTDAPFAIGPRDEVRTPFFLKNYLPDDVSPDAALAVHHQFVEEGGNPAFTAEHNVLRLLTVVRGLEAQPATAWESAAPFYFTMAEGRIGPAQADANDLMHLTQGLVGLMLASPVGPRPALVQIAQRMQSALGITINEETRGVTIGPQAMECGLRMLAQWKQVGATMQPILRRYLQAQLSQALFPFAGLGSHAAERLIIIAVRLATVKLALMAHAVELGRGPTAEEAVQTIYTLSRFLDHLADPTLSLAIYEETGWVRDARLRALLGDHALS